MLVLPLPTCPRPRPSRPWRGSTSDTYPCPSSPSAPPSSAVLTSKFLAGQCLAGVSSGRRRGDGWSFREIQTQSSLVAGRSRWANREEVKSALFDWLLLTEIHPPRQQVIKGRGLGQGALFPHVSSPLFPLPFDSALARYPRQRRVSNRVMYGIY